MGHTSLPQVTTLLSKLIFEQLELGFTNLKSRIIETDLQIQAIKMK